MKLAPAIQSRKHNFPSGSGNENYHTIMETPIIHNLGSMKFTAQSEIYQ